MFVNHGTGLRATATCTSPSVTPWYHGAVAAGPGGSGTTTTTSVRDSQYGIVNESNIDHYYPPCSEVGYAVHCLECKQLGLAYGYMLDLSCLSIGHF